MKRLSLTSLMCRHPVASGFMHVLIGSLLYGPVTWGRLLFVTFSTFMVIWRVSHEERELLDQGGQGYKQFREEVPSLMIPDYRVLFYTDNQLNGIRNSVFNASKLSRHL